MGTSLDPIGPAGGGMGKVGEDIDNCGWTRGCTKNRSGTGLG